MLGVEARIFVELMIFVEISVEEIADFYDDDIFYINEIHLFYRTHDGVGGGLAVQHARVNVIYILFN